MSPETRPTFTDPTPEQMDEQVAFDARADEQGAEIGSDDAKVNVELHAEDDDAYRERVKRDGYVFETPLAADIVAELTPDEAERDAEAIRFKTIEALHDKGYYEKLKQDAAGTDKRSTLGGQPSAERARRAKEVLDQPVPRLEQDYQARQPEPLDEKNVNMVLGFVAGRLREASGLIRDEQHKAEWGMKKRNEMMLAQASGQQVVWPANGEATAYSDEKRSEAAGQAFAALRHLLASNPEAKAEVMKRYDDARERALKSAGVLEDVKPPNPNPEHKIGTGTTPRAVKIGRKIALEEAFVAGGIASPFDSTRDKLAKEKAEWEDYESRDAAFADEYGNVLRQLTEFTSEYDQHWLAGVDAEGTKVSDFSAFRESLAEQYSQTPNDVERDRREAALARASGTPELGELLDSLSGAEVSKAEMGRVMSEWRLRGADDADMEYAAFQRLMHVDQSIYAIDAMLGRVDEKDPAFAFLVRQREKFQKASIQGHYSKSQFMMERAADRDETTPDVDRNAGRHAANYTEGKNTGMAIEQRGTNGARVWMYPDGSFAYQARGGNTSSERLNPDGTPWVRYPSAEEAALTVGRKTRATNDRIANQRLAEPAQRPQLASEREQALSAWTADQASPEKAAVAKSYMDATLQELNDVKRLQDEAASMRAEADGFTAEQLQDEATAERAADLRYQATQKDRTAGNIHPDYEAANKARYWANYLQMALKPLRQTGQQDRTATGEAIFMRQDGRVTTSKAEIYGRTGYFVLSPDGSVERTHELAPDGTPRRLATPNRYDPEGNARP
jgi:hypothetical protein